MSSSCIQNGAKAIVVTSVNHPSSALRALATGAVQYGVDFIVVGDVKSPSDFYLSGCTFLSMEWQRQSDFRYAVACPINHYARKNVGYLEAIRRGASLIIETDDDNIPLNQFFEPKTYRMAIPASSGDGWVNVYRWFSGSKIWPRGFPIDAVNMPPPSFEHLPVREVECPIQQGLADGNPDVDAIYRLVMPLPVTFRSGRRVALGAGSWCPFNSQNTTWWADAYGLLYLPSFCSFRMTDIWRSFVAQRIAWANDWNIMFHEATVAQERNEHNLMRDFADEVPGYLNNRLIADALSHLNIRPGVAAIPENLRRCYSRLVELNVVGCEELRLLNLWLEDLERLGCI